MNVLIVEEQPPGGHGRFAQLAHAATEPRHTVVESAEEADVILFADPHRGDWRRTEVRRHEFVARHPRKCLVYDEADTPWLAWPGIYVSAPSSRFDARWQRPWMYASIDEDRFVPLRDETPTMLASLVASPTHPCREPLFELDDSRLDARRADAFLFYDSASKDFDVRRREFERAMRDSRFVLCPRGHGTASFRLQEVLAAGRVPVIISDEWVPPWGVDLSECTIRWPERGAATLLDHLASIPEREAARMSATACAVYDRYFGREHAFNRIVDLAVDLLVTLPERPFPAHGWSDPYRARLELRHNVGPLKRRILERARGIVG